MNKGSCSPQDCGHIFCDAVLSWQMEDMTGLEAEGDAATGLELHGAEREASLARGGNGIAALIRGGCLRAGSDLHADLSGSRSMTLSIRLCDTEGTWNSPIFSRCDPGSEYNGILYCSHVNPRDIGYETEKRLAGDRSLEFMWRGEPVRERVRAEFLDSDWYRELLKISGQDFVDGIMRIGAPVDVFGASGWHDILVRFNNAVLELFVDGVLVDEDWPHGSLLDFRGPFLIGAGMEAGRIKTGFTGMIDHVAIWDRALSDAEIERLSGGKPATEARRKEIEGREQSSLQYWLPPGHNTFVGDCMPFFHNGEFHLYYLFDRRHHRSKWGMGAHQFAHASTRDLVNWTHHPIALPITRQWECSLGTGSFIHREGKRHLFYIHHGKRAYFRDAPHIRETILSAVSDDGLIFRKKPDPVVPLDYREFGDVNPDLFSGSGGGRCYMSISGWKFFESDDLRGWEENRQFESPRDIPRWICCSSFEWNGWYYYAGMGWYRMSREPPAPNWNWIQPEHPATRDGLHVPQIAAFSGNRHIMAGFLWSRGGFAGELVFRELLQHPDGTLGTKFPREMAPESRRPLSPPFCSSGGAVSGAGRRAAIKKHKGFACGYYDGIPENVRVTLNVGPDAGSGGFGLCFRGSGDYESGFELRFEPGRERAQLAAVTGGKRAREADRTIEGVGGLDKEFSLDIIVKNDFVDVCIDGRRTMIARISGKTAGERLFLFAEDAAAAFEDVFIRELT